MNYSRLLTLLILIISLFFLAACNNEYGVLSKEYNQIYNEIGKEVDIDVLITIEKFKIEEIATKINQLEKLLKEMKLIVPNKKAVEYEEYLKQYEGLIIIKNSADWKNLSVEQRGAATTENALIRIRMR